MMRARDRAEAGLAGAKKQGQDQLRRLLEAEDQLKIAKEQVADLKQKLAEAEGAKNVVEFARDEALRAREEAEFARAKAQLFKKTAEEEAFALGVAETQATLKAQVLGVCRLYYSQVWNEALKQARVEASFDLWKVENVYYPPAIREATFANSEADTTSEAANKDQASAANEPTPTDRPAEKVEHPGVSEKEKTSNHEVPQGVMNPQTDLQVPHAEKGLASASPVVPSEAALLGQGFEAPDAASQQIPKDKLSIKLKKQVDCFWVFVVSFPFFVVVVLGFL